MALALLYGAAALAEIAGCFAVWAWWRGQGTVLWLLPAGALLALFAWLLAVLPSASAGRTFAAYGAVYIAASLGWMWLVEGVRPQRSDLAGAALALAGAAVIVTGARIRG